MAGGLPLPIPRTFTVAEVETAAYLNSVRDGLNFLLNPPHFKGSITTATALTTGTNIAFPVVEDTYGGWDATNHWWVAPSNVSSGLYLVTVQFKWNSGPGSNPSIQVKGGASGTSALLYSPNASGIGGFQGMQVCGFVRAAAGDKVGVQISGAGFTTIADSGSPDNNFFSIGFYSA